MRRTSSKIDKKVPVASLPAAPPLLLRPSPRPARRERVAVVDVGRYDGDGALEEPPEEILNMFIQEEGLSDETESEDDGGPAPESDEDTAPDPHVAL